VSAVEVSAVEVCAAVVAFKAVQRRSPEALT